MDLAKISYTFLSNTRHILSRVNKKKVVTTALFAALVLLILFVSDYLFSNYVNHKYVFELRSLKWSYLAEFYLIIFLICASPRPIRVLLLVLIAIITLFQYLTFEYFGANIRPIHYVQLLPDFMLIFWSFEEAIGEMTSTIVGWTMAVAILASILFFAQKKMISSSYAALALAAIILWNGIASYILLNPKNGKFHGRTTSTLLPKVNLFASHNAYRSFIYLTLGIFPKKYLHDVEEIAQLEKPVLKQASPQHNIVLVVGETQRASQMSLLGYKGNHTTPLLENVPNLLARSIYSAGTMTRTSFAGLFNRLKYPGLQKQYASQSNCLFRLAHENGFKTHFVYGYNYGSFVTLRPFLCAQYIDNVRANNLAPSKFRNMDRNLNYELTQIDLSKPNFIVLANRGSHTPYKNKFTKEFDKFPSPYDNSFLYTDTILTQLIKTLQTNSPLPTYFMYTSDHGELLKGESDRRGHGWFRKDVYKVPFLYKEFNSGTPSANDAALNVRSHFDLSTLVVQLLGYDAKVADNKIKTIFVNGSDLHGLAGILKVEIRDDRVVEETKLN